MTPALEARALSRSYRVSRGPFRAPGRIAALVEVSFALEAGRTLAVVGESGSGKSTLARILCGLDAPSSGELRLAGRDVTSALAGGGATARARQMIFQDPFGSLNPRLTVAALVAEPLEIEGSVARSEARRQALAMLDRVGLRPEHADRYPHMFSGGQRQRIAIARALILRPHVLVADEPVSALDVSIRAQILNLLEDLQAEMRLALVLVSHDLHTVRHVADEVLVMYLGHMVEHGPTARVLDAARHPYTRALLSSTPSTLPGRRQARLRFAGELPSPLDPPVGCVVNGRCPFASERCRERAPEPRDIDGRLVACHHADEPALGTVSQGTQR